MAKKKEYTFADAAKQVMKRFPRRETDPIEKRDYEQAMQELQQEQEMVRQQMGLIQPQEGMPQEQFKCGGKMKYPDGGGLPNQGVIYQDDRNWLQRQQDNLFGTWQANKPQLFKDFPITDPVSYGLQYTTGNTPDTGMQTGIPGLIGTPVGAYPKTGRYLDDALDFATDAYGIKYVPNKVGPGMNVAKAPVYNPVKPINTRIRKKIGLNKVPKTSLGNTAIDPSTSFTKAGVSTATPTRDALRNMTASDRALILDLKSKGASNKQIQQELNKAFGRTGAGTTKIGSTRTSVVGDATPSNLQMINGKLYQIDPSTGVKIPWGNIAKVIGAAGVLGGGAYGVSQIPLTNSQGQPVQNNTNKPLDLIGYDLQSVLDYTNSLYPQGNQALTPQQLASMGQPWERPSQQVPTGQGGSQRTVGTPPINESGVNRNPLLTDTTKMGMRVGDRVFTRPGENMGARVGGVFVSGTGNPNINVGASIPAQNLETNKINSFGQSQVNKAGEMAEKSWWDKNKQYAPYAISGLSNIASNLLLANMAKRNQPRVSAAMATPERINLEPQAEALRGQAGVAKNVASTNARNLGLNPMQAMASMSAAGTGIDRNLGDALTNLYMQQEGANVGAANQFNLANAQSQNRANMMNAQLDQQALENRLGYTGAALGSLPGVMKDIRMDKADQATRDMYSTYFKSMGRNYMNEGDIWDNPKDGYRYVVRNNQLVKQGKSK